jgi:hypothetical protein
MVQPLIGNALEIVSYQITNNEIEPLKNTLSLERYSDGYPHSPIQNLR